VLPRTIVNDMDNDEEVQLRVALYLRVSTDEQVEKFGLPAQRSAIEGVIKSRGKLKDGRDAFVLAGKNYEYVDDISGSTEVDERPEFTRLKEDVLNAPAGQKPFDIVAVYKIDRFARKLSVLLDVLQFFKQYKIEFISSTESIDTSTPFGRAMLGIMGIIAELELETIKERTQRGRAQANLEGVFMGANTPYGYKKNKNGQLIILEDEAKIVKEIFRMFIVDKKMPQMIADTLQDLEVLSPDVSAIKNKKRKGVSRKLHGNYFWRPEKIREILSDEVYTGKLYYDKSKNNKPLPKSEWKESPHRHTAIVYGDLFELAKVRLQELADRKSLTQKKMEGHIYPLSGLLKCDHCKEFSQPGLPEMMSWTGGKKLISKNPLNHSYYYFCNRKNIKKFSKICPVVPIPAESIEEYVINFIKQLLSNPQAVYEYQKQLTSTKLNTKQLESDKEHFEGLLNALPLRKQALKEQHKNLIIDTQTLQKELNELNEKEKLYKEKMSEIDYKLSQATLSKGYEASLKQYAEKYGKSLNKVFEDKQELYELIHGLIYQITVFSRPRTSKDVIAGRKKENQFIPERIDIALNLPQNLLRELYTHKFGVRSAEL
jgi:site-specific DNA recombinase